MNNIDGYVIIIITTIILYPIQRLLRARGDKVSVKIQTAIQNLYGPSDSII